MSSEADIKDCPGVSVGHAHSFFFFLNVVFIKKASISREVWLGWEAGEGWVGRQAGKEAGKGKLPPEFSNNAVIYAAAEMCIVLGNGFWGVKK